MDITLLLVLIVLNGAFAMSEMAVVSSRRARLIQRSEQGRTGARAALALSENPSHFLSTIQIGITAIGILSGVLGETALAQPLAVWLAQFEPLQPYATGVAVASVVAGVTALSLIFGELVPKRIALQNPETIASMIARPMGWLSAVTYPLVRLLSAVTDAIVALLGGKGGDGPPVTEEEIHVLMEQGRAAGVFDPHEQDIVRRAFLLDDVRVSAVMTPRHDLVEVRSDDGVDVVRRIIREHGYSRYPVVNESGEIIGLLRSKMVVDKLLSGDPVETAALVEKSLFVPGSLTLMRLLELFKKSRQRAAIVVDEFGRTLGMVTLNDVLTSLVGNIAEVDQQEDSDVVGRPDGSWLMAGSVSIEVFRDVTQARQELPEEAQESYDTLGGLAMVVLQRIPRTGDRFETGEFTFEVVDMDLHRVDKLLVTRKPGAAAKDDGKPRTSAADG